MNAVLALLTTERARPEPVRRAPWAWRLAVGTVCFGAFMGQLDASIVTLTYQPLRTEFHSTPAAVEWVSLSYLLTLTAILVPVGRLSDARGRKLMYLYGFAVFTIASAACGLAPGLAALVVFRVVQAVGAALMQANSVALVTTSAPPGRMRAALGMQAAGQALGLALGPTVGGALVSAVGWRWVFGVNVPIGVLALVAGHYLLPRTRQCTGGGRIDLPGVLLLGGSTTAALLALSVASGLGLPIWSAALLAVAAVGAGWAFLRRQRACARPLLDLALLRERRLGPGLLGGLCGYLVLFGPLVLVPLALARTGSTPLATGLVLTALPLGFALAATGAERLLPAGWSDGRRGQLGAAGCVLALALLAALPMRADLLPLPLGLLGLALGIYVPANNTQVMRAIPTSSAGTGGGMVNMTRGLGTAIGVAAVTLAMHLAPGTGPTAAALTLLAFALLALATTLRPPR
ncbi:MFS transporter [Kitasatospora viridis]|uniref:MFS transporter n=1 Tax=Kitasatospora viridis TaxID=281105 RepID=A0A561UPL8_9ACTN|nr:MFS transporter [Kitasatospora viridis]TWG01317.1 MFS transporter [Kitasatospora viridis]